jgi:outer membrane protein assembly factor BamB
VAAGQGVRTFERALGVVGVLALAITVALVTGWNPLPRVGSQLSDLLQHTTSLSKPDAAWLQRLGGQPSSATVAGHAVVVAMRGVVEAHDITTGARLWSRDADWGAVAGGDGSAVVVVGHHGHGFEVVGPDTGDVRWRDGAALGAWTYRDALLSLTCPALSDCTLASRGLLDGAARWRVVLPGVGRVLAGLNSPLLGSRQLTSSSYVDAIAAHPAPVPPVLGFPLDQRVQVVDTASGRRLRQETPTQTTRVVVVAGRILLSTAVRRDGNCRYTLEARDAASGATVWRKEGYDLRTASGAGCEQRRDPSGSGGVLAATRGDNRDVLLSARDGRELWVGGPGESAVATDGRYLLARTAEHNRIKAVDLDSGAALWSREAGAKSEVALTPYAALVLDRAAGRLLAVEPAGGRTLLELSTQASVLGYGPTGLVLYRGRTVGFIPFGSA